MTGFYKFIDTLKDELQENVFVSTVTYGDIFDVDLGKKTIFPLSHFLVNSYNYNGPALTFNVSLLCMDIIDISNEDATDKFIQKTNEQDIWNTQMNVVNRTIEKLRRGDLFSDSYQLSGEPSVEAFTDRFDNKLAGWTVTFDVDVRNETSIC